MSDSLDLRQRVVEFVRQGGSKSEAAQLFNVSRGCVYAWLKLPPDQLAARKTRPKRARKLDMQALKEWTPLKFDGSGRSS
ncbi:MAG: IS630 transposase-related protein [Geitlerinemataceae cyanobacterium]